MWSIFEHRRIAKQLAKLPTEIIGRYEVWKNIIELSGPTGLRAIKGFKDENLVGEWKGYRSSRLSIQYRVIYQVDGKKFFVTVVEVTPHDYKRKS
jgi:hypothetical protein